MNTLGKKSWLRHWVMIHLCGAWMNKISGAMTFLYDPLLEFIHHRYTQSTLISQYTISLSKANTFCFWTFALNSRKMGYLSCFSINFDTSDDPSPFLTTIPHYLESISLTHKSAIYVYVLLTLSFLPKNRLHYT